jgi:hypothetical protein
LHFRRKQWLLAVQREDLLNKKTGMFVCSDHFSDSMFEDDRRHGRLHKHALPSMLDGHRHLLQHAFTVNQDPLSTSVTLVGERIVNPNSLSTGVASVGMLFATASSLSTGVALVGARFATASSLSTGVALVGARIVNPNSLSTGVDSSGTRFAVSSSLSIGVASVGTLLITPTTQSAGAASVGTLVINPSSLSTGASFVRMDNPISSHSADAPLSGAKSGIKRKVCPILVYSVKTR